jgi:molybdopterin-containing oxidoreductase family membrane subunit
MFLPTIWDVAVYAGTFGLFLTGMVFFVRFLPMIPMSEMRHDWHHAKHPEKKEAEVSGGVH